ncbi:MAG: amino acid ABC transporter permease [Christensenellales bacterium]|jgi:polar amino acid transport system permease protein
MKYFQDIGKLGSLLQQMLQGTLVTVEIWVFTLVFALPLGLLICQMRLSKNPVFKGLSNAYIFFFRGTPLLLQVTFVFFGVPIIFGFTFDRVMAAIVAFILNYAAYFAEIYRGGIQSIPKGQYEAAHVLGLSNKVTFLKVILPQVAKRIVPPMGNELITLVKDTALVYAIGINELLREAKIAMLRDITIMPFVIAAVFYLIMTGGLTKLLGYVERKFAYYR